MTASATTATVVERLAYSIDEVIEATTLGRTTVFALIASGELRSKLVRGRRLVPVDALRQFLDPSVSAAS
jgi:excisionase family DNA binding protein